MHLDSTMANLAQSPYSAAAAEDNPHHANLSIDISVTDLYLAVVGGDWADTVPTIYDQTFADELKIFQVHARTKVFPME